MSGKNHYYSSPTIATLLLLSACSTTDDRFPSLERRSFETTAPVAAPTPPAVPVALPYELSLKVDELIARHERASANFTKALPPVQKIAANAAKTTPGSESWVNAHLQLSRLDKMRADSVAALGELDKFIAEQIDADSAYVDLLTERQQKASTEVAAQRDEVERLSQLIGE